MMTGQILGGQSPIGAASYQIMIYHAIATSSCLTAVILSAILTARTFDLRGQALVPWILIPGLRKKSNDSERMGTQHVDSTSHAKLTFSDHAKTSKSTKPLLSIKDLTVESTKLYVPSLEIRAGDRIGVSGVSGIGKSQLLRALARLDPISPESKTTMTLHGQSFSHISPAEWRTEIMWASQDRPTLSGTPRSFYEEVVNYRSRRHDHSNNRESIPSGLTPMEIASEWNLPSRCWDQSWNDLSGGESQRASLAIALSLQPKLLLLDEPTASCDSDSTAKIEKTLIESNTTLLIVSHSQEQLKRCCTGVMELA